MRNTDKLQKEGRLQLIDWINRDGRENFLVLLNSTFVVMIYCCCSVHLNITVVHCRDHVTRLKPKQRDHPLKFAAFHNQSPLLTMFSRSSAQKLALTFSQRE